MTQNKMIATNAGAAPEAGSAPVSVRRHGSGAIDLDHYKTRLRKLRTRWMRRQLRGLFSRVARLWRRSEIEAELSALDKRMLHDMGITSGDILAIARGNFARDDSRRQRGA
jgi:uncharacterized protein YjiS (DUF1127 family)